MQSDMVSFVKTIFKLIHDNLNNLTIIKLQKVFT